MDPVEALVRLGGVADAATLMRLASRRRLRTALTAGRVVRDGRGRYALPTAAEASRAASRLSGVVSHASAAAHYGWKSKWPPPEPCVTVPRKRRVAAARREGVALHWVDLAAEERRAGVTGKARTVIDCAKTLPFDEALAIADSAVRNDDVTSEELLWYARQVPTTGREQSLRVAQEADGRAHNPFESVLRAIALDVPGLRVQPQLPVRCGGLWLHPDLGDRDRLIAIEAESFEFHSDMAALVRDCERYNELGIRGWTVYRFTWGNVMHAPWYVRQVLTAAVALPLRPAA
jgi:hypothetical protein